MRMYDEYISCPRCGGYVKHERSYEYADRDGNRGIWLDFYTCMECDWEPGDGDDWCTDCRQRSDECVCDEEDME